MTEQQHAPQRFRSSCTNCASAKVKCNATRPDCARCTERGLACLYAPSNRYGRRPASSKANQPRSAFPSNRLLLSRNVTDWPHEDAAFGTQQPCITPVPVPVPIHVPSALDLELSELDGAGAMQSLATGIMSSTLISNALGDNLNTFVTSSHCCLTEAAQLLTEARAVESDWRRSSQDMNLQDVEQTLQDVLWSNRKILDRVAMILTCDCTSADYQIVVLISLVWFHVVDKYSQTVAAARHVGDLTQRARIKSLLDVLLGELRDLSPLVESLSDRGAEGRPAHGGMGVSGTVFKHLQSDLTRYLCHLYLNTEQLRQDLV
ncbi:hypothetical protein BDW69DRAFT_189442 [Aspergillus filifer]